MEAAQMTSRVRLYLYGASARHLLLGLSLLLVPAAFNPVAYANLFSLAPRWVWISTLFCGAAHLAYAGIAGNEAAARAALILTAALSVMWGVAFVVIVTSGIPAMTACILFLDLAWKDLVICSGPLRSPLAPVIRSFRNEAS